MRILPRTFLVFASATLSFAATAAQRTFVASDGLDTNPCTIVAPCRGFAAALAHTDPGGEIVVRDSAGYGRVTITQSVSIIAPSGIYAGISVFSGTNGIDINAAGVKVLLSGLTINGQGGNVGINFVSGAQLTIERCTIANMAYDGVDASAFNSTLVVRDSVVRNNAVSGISLANLLTAVLERVSIEQNGVDGIAAEGGVTAAISDSTFLNNIGPGIWASSHLGVARIEVERSRMYYNEYGILAEGHDQGTTIVGASHNEISFNHTDGVYGLAVSSGSVRVEAVENVIRNNVRDGLSAEGYVSMMIASGNVASGNGRYGMNTDGVATIKSAHNNVTEDNGLGATNGGPFSLVTLN